VGRGFESLRAGQFSPRDGMVDITDLKSVAFKAWEFESPRGYQDRQTEGKPGNVAERTSKEKSSDITRLSQERL
jgi:hypothetical protein